MDKVKSDTQGCCEKENIATCGTYIHTNIYVFMMEYYSTIKNEIMPLAAMWVNLQIFVLCEVSLVDKNII